MILGLIFNMNHEAYRVDSYRIGYINNIKMRQNLVDIDYMFVYISVYSYGTVDDIHSSHIE